MLSEPRSCSYLLLQHNHSMNYSYFLYNTIKCKLYIRHLYRWASRPICQIQCVNLCFLCYPPNYVCNVQISDCTYSIAVNPRATIIIHGDTNEAKQKDVICIALTNKSVLANWYPCSLFPYIGCQVFLENILPYWPDFPLTYRCF